jgi:hypothetical protein
VYLHRKSVPTRVSIGKTNHHEFSRNTYISVLVASPNPSSLGDFYTYLTTKATDTRFTAPNNQPLLSIRLRDVLVKLITIVGAPPVVVAVSALAKAEGKAEEKAEGSQLSEKWYPIYYFLSQLNSANGVQGKLRHLRY